MKTAQDADVLVVGAGMVGATAALAMARAGLTVVLIDQGTAPAEAGSGPYDLRVSALGRGSQQVMQAIGVWESMRSRRVAPFRRMCVWDARSSGSIEFDSAELGYACLGHIVENQLVTHCLHEGLSRQSGVRLLYQAEPQRLVQHDDHVTVSLASGETLRAPLVVGADGANSWLRAQLDIEEHVTPYGQRALVAEVATERAHDDTAWQRFLPTGPVAFLPLANGHSSVVWSCDDSLAAELQGLDDEAFAARLAEAFGYRLGTVRLCGPRRGFALRRAHSDAYVAPRGALIGDAAHTVHPLAGLGANLGIADAAALTEVLAAAHARDKDVGQYAVLRRYERWRKGENLAAIQVLDGLQKLFGDRAAPLRCLRGFGMSLTDRLTPLKHHLARRAMGLGGDLPRLARGLQLEAVGR